MGPSVESERGHEPCICGQCTFFAAPSCSLWKGPSREEIMQGFARLGTLPHLSTFATLVDISCELAFQCKVWGLWPSEAKAKLTPTGLLLNYNTFSTPSLHRAEHLRTKFGHEISWLLDQLRGSCRAKAAFLLVASKNAWVCFILICLSCNQMSMQWTNRLYVYRRSRDQARPDLCPLPVC